MGHNPLGPVWKTPPFGFELMEIRKYLDQAILEHILSFYRIWSIAQANHIPLDPEQVV